MQTELEMAVSAVVADWSGARYVNGSNELLEDYMTKERVESNMNTADYELKEFELNTENGVVVGYKDKDYNFTVEITSSGNSAKVIYEGNSEGSSGGSGSGDEEEEPENPDEGNPDEEEPPVVEEGENFAEAITEASHYGDYVEYSIDLNEDGNITNDWRIFYNDGEHIFIIAADYVKNTSSYLNNTGTGMSTYSAYGLYWNSAPGSAQSVSQASLFGQTLWADYSTNLNGICVSILLNTSNWTGFIDGTYGEYAVGGPTVEMWVASYNAKGYTPLYCNNTDSEGYFIGNTDTPTTTYYYLDEDANTGYGDTLYFPHQEAVSNCYGYWLASPSAVSTDRVEGVFYDGRVSNYRSYDFLVGVRPLVSLKSEVTAVQNADTGVWELSM